MTKENKTMTELAESAFRKMVEPFIKHPENLEVNCFQERSTIIVEARAHYADTGKIIGKGKANFTAVSTILALIGFRNGVNIRLNNLLPSKVGGQEFLTPFDNQDDWPEQQTTADLEEILKMFLAQTFTLIIGTEKVHDEEWTVYTIGISEKEKLPISSAQIARELSKIFHAIGKERGRRIKVEASKTYEKAIAH